MRINYINNKSYTEYPESYFSAGTIKTNTYDNTIKEFLPSEYVKNRIQDNDDLTLNRQTYQVKAGDNLSHIARTHLLDAGQVVNNNQIYTMVESIVRENGLQNPNIIYPGQTLKIPFSESHSVHNSVNNQPTYIDTVRNRLPHLTTLNTPSNHNDSEVFVPLHFKISQRSTHESLDTNNVISQKPLPSGGPYHAGLPLENYRQPALFPLPNWKRRTDANQHANTNRAINNPTVQEFQRKNIASPRPVKSADKTSLNQTSPWIKVLPESAVLTSEFGTRRDPFTGERSFHNGIDLAAEHGTPIRAYAPGSVVFSGWQSGYGKVVIIRHDDGHESVYGHNAKNMVRKGERVNENSVIGLIGTTGRSTGPHLHFEIRVEGKAVNPIPYLTG